MTTEAPWWRIGAMRLLSESAGIDRLAKIREDFRGEIVAGFEYRSKPCSVCETPGVCCLDEHFVNLRVSRLEAAAIRNAVSELDAKARSAVFSRLSKIDKNAEFYSCPLFQTGVGCLVHDTAKPLPCIAHACYERKEDLPPDELLAEREVEIDKLNRRVYGKSEPFLPIPVALSRLLDLPADDRNGDQQPKEDEVIPEGQIVPRYRLHHDTEQQ